MADREIYNGTAEFIPNSGMTPFAFYDNDASFVADAPKVVRFVCNRLGWPLMDVELQSGSIFTAFEEAVTTYGNTIYEWKVKENYLSLEGGSAAESANNLVLEPTLNRVVEISKNYGSEADVGGNVPINKGMIQLRQGVQDYDLNEWAEEQNIEGGIEIRKVFYEAPPAILRYFDPYAGTGTGIQSLMDAFDFGSYSPGVNFLLMPISHDLLQVQAIEFNDQIRKSTYSFQVVNNNLRIFPIPTRDMMLRVDYYKLADKRKLGSTESKESSPIITNVSEVPYENPTYSKINSIGRQWIYRYTLALSKEMLAYIRGKYSTIPIPDSETTLNHADLLSDARTEKEKLLQELNDTLDTSSRQSQLERKSKEAEFLRTTLGSVPTLIFIG